MNCKTCTYYPCLKVQCNIGNKEGCNDYKNFVQSEIEKIDKEAERRERE